MSEITITQSEIDAALAEARKLRAQATRDMFRAVSRFVANALHVRPARTRAA